MTNPTRNKTFTAAPGDHLPVPIPAPGDTWAGFQTGPESTVLILCGQAFAAGDDLDVFDAAVAGGLPVAVGVTPTGHSGFVWLGLPDGESLVQAAFWLPPEVWPDGSPVAAMWTVDADGCLPVNVIGVDPVSSLVTCRRTVRFDPGVTAAFLDVVASMVPCSWELHETEVRVVFDALDVDESFEMATAAGLLTSARSS